MRGARPALAQPAESADDDAQRLLAIIKAQEDRFRELEKALRPEDQARRSSERSAEFARQPGYAPRSSARVKTPKTSETSLIRLLCKSYFTYGLL